MKKLSILIALFVIISGCDLSTNGNISQDVLISSKGEKIYIKAINWGMTDDYQLTLITSDKKRLKSIKDTTGTIKGLDPFLYSFQKDTLKLFLIKGHSFKINDTFKTIKIQFNFVNEQDYQDLKVKLLTIPLTKKTIYPNDMPVPPGQK